MYPLSTYFLHHYSQSLLLLPAAHVNKKNIDKLALRTYIYLFLFFFIARNSFFSSSFIPNDLLSCDYHFPLLCSTPCAILFRFVGPVFSSLHCSRWLKTEIFTWPKYLNRFLLWTNCTVPRTCRRKERWNNRKIYSIFQHFCFVSILIFCVFAFRRDK